MGSPVGGPSNTEDVGNLQVHAHRVQPGGDLSPSAPSAGRAALRPRGSSGERCRFELAVPEQHLNDADVDILLEQVGGEAVPQRMRADALADAATSTAS